MCTLGRVTPCTCISGTVYPVCMGLLSACCVSVWHCSVYGVGGCGVGCFVCVGWLSVDLAGRACACLLASYSMGCDCMLMRLRLSLWFCCRCCGGCWLCLCLYYLWSAYNRFRCVGFTGVRVGSFGCSVNIYCILTTCNTTVYRPCLLFFTIFC